MSLITLFWGMTSAICFTIAFQQFNIWLKLQNKYRYLFAGITAIGGGGNALVELYTLKATEISQLITGFILMNITVAVIIVGLTWLIYFYFKTSKKYIAWAITFLWFIALVINVFSEFSITFSKISLSNQNQDLWGEAILSSISEINPLKIIPDIATFLFVYYVIDSTIRLWKKREKKRALLIGGSIIFFILVAFIHTLLLDEAIIQTPPIISFVFLGIMIALSYEMGSDIIQSSEISKQLLHNEKRWRSLLEDVNLIVLGLDRDGSVNYVNPYFLKFSGYKEHELLGANWFDNFLPKDAVEFIKPKFENLEAENLPSHRNKILLSNGNEKIIEWSNVKLFDSNQNVISTISIGIDITEKEKAFKEIIALKEKLEVENIQLKEELIQAGNGTDIIGNSDVIKYALTRIEQVANSETSVLIEGETGVGKELFARAIHQASNRANIPMVTINCAAMPSNLIESELFGHEKGAFTGADKLRKGRFEFADSGTLFLDEIGELPLELQSKLLRLLESGEFERLGSNKTLKVDVRIIAATNRNLLELSKEGEFREDLYYRISTYPISIPPLRQRKEDISLMIENFIDYFGRKHGKSIENISKESLEMLKNYDWPGNVRELRNVIERAVIGTDGNKLILYDKLKPSNNSTSNSTFKSLENVEREYILSVLENCNWKITGAAGAAEILELHPNTLRSRMKKLGIEKSN